MALINIFLIVFILSATFLCIFATVYLKRTFEQVEAVRKDIHYLIENTIPVLSNLEEITQRTNKIMTEAEGYWDEINYSIRNLRRTISEFGSLKKFCYARTHNMELIKNLRSIAKGVSAFWSDYKSR